ncbi:MAG TPA: DUF6569 family protein [Candidatus Angelobacter sp.]|nr:DUF6569 family protein [Candidatus Angelobacter sp.]
MKQKLILGTLMMVAPVLLLMARGMPGGPGAGLPEPAVREYKVLQPISRGNLTIFPVVAAGKIHDTSDFLTLDEGIRSGDVVVTEVGKMHTMVRRPPQNYHPSGAQVNTLVLVNNSKRPLILLAGEIVTGGKQDRVVGKDRIIAPESDPVDLSVFCVEPGRWVESSAKFDTHNYFMAQPSVRKRVVEDKDQQKVWAEVQSQKANIAQNLAAAPGIAGRSASNGGTSSTSQTVEVNGANVEVTTTGASALRELDSTTSYAKARANSAVQEQIKSIADPVEKSFESVIKQLRDQNAVGVVVAVKGRIIWADIFASRELLSKYWPKLLQSYAAEAFSATGGRGDSDLKSAQEFVDNWRTRHEVVDSEPGLYRQTEMTGDTFRAFELTSLLPKQVFDLHLSKMAE